VLILIVEDSPLNLELMTDLLEFEGLQVVTADTAEEGLRLAAERLPSLILMDLGLPGMGGLQAVRALREQPSTAHIPVVAVTAQGSRQDRERVREAGCVGCLIKPINVDTFAGEVTRLAGG